MHPKALTRLGDKTIRQIVLILLAAELFGSWPDLVGWIVVVLLPKTDGGRRPIGLIPLPPLV